MADDNFFDKILELGMGMAVANQIPGLMNSVLPGTAPQRGAQIPPREGIQFYAIINNNQVGPLNEEEVIILIGRKYITEDTLIWKPGMKNWQVASKVPEVGKLILLHETKQ